MLSQLEQRTTIPAREHSSILATVLYEDVESGLRARALMESVEANMDFPAAFQLDLWRFDWLAERSLGNIALSRADRSALVLIAAGSSAPLPVIRPAFRARGSGTRRFVKRPARVGAIGIPSWTRRARGR